MNIQLLAFSLNPKNIFFYKMFAPILQEILFTISDACRPLDRPYDVVFLILLGSIFNQIYLNVLIQVAYALNTPAV